MSNLLTFLALAAGWFVLTRFILPWLGLPT
jgi:hypothetical protein